MLETQSTRRLKWLLWLMLVWVAAIFGRLVMLQVFQHDKLLHVAEQQQQKTVEIPALRGSIFDRNGQPLAKSLPAESILVNPMKIPDATVAADILSRVLDLDRKPLYARLVAAKARNSGFLWIKRKVVAEEAARIRSLKLDWVEFREEVRRFYPHGQLAAHVLGSTGIVSADDTVERGNAGLERAFDDELAGEAGTARVYRDVLNKPYEMVTIRKPEPGADLTLTIDANLQFDAEKTLAQAVEKTHAKSGSVVALNPYNGEILALANYPTYDPNQTPKPDDPPFARSNLAVSTPFEPGSVFKVITLAAALETTNLTPDTMINCGGGTINLFGRVIHDHDRYAALTMAEVLAKSSNIGAINIGLKVGEKKLYEYVRKFGFGQKTGVDLPAESAGMLRRLQNWEPSSIGSVAMGHEVGATSLQLALAGAVVANGGRLMKPRLVMKQQKPGAPEYVLPVEKPERVIRPETAIKMRQMMEGVVLRGTGKKAILRGYTSGGKTGSAQIYDFKTKSYTHTYNASFLGFAPVANPQIVIAVTLVGTSGGGSGFGGVVAAPVFHDVATSALRMMDVPKDIPETLLAKAKTNDKDSDNDLAIAGLGAAPVELAQAIVKDSAPSGFPDRETATAVSGARQRSVSSVTLPPVQGEPTVITHGVAAVGSSIGEPSLAQPSLDRRPFLNARSGTGAVVPDFRGMTLRSVLEESAAKGMPVEVRGDGMVRAQDPPPGAELAPGSKIRVVFTR
jgi:cell division protein FtsI (penicillin-binding protein 3)